jgi:hypothetical protein
MFRTDGGGDPPAAGAMTDLLFGLVFFGEPSGFWLVATASGFFRSQASLSLACCGDDPPPELPLLDGAVALPPASRDVTDGWRLGPTGVVILPQRRL